MKQIMDSTQVLRTLKRISHEIIERNDDLENVVLVGIKSKGKPIAEIIQKNITAFEGIYVSVEEIDISKYRDDHKRTDIDFINIETSLVDKNVILVDDVLFTGRSVRAAMDAIMDVGRAKRIQLAVLVDRGHRELPIRADYVGKNIPTARTERIVFDAENFEISLS